MYQYVVLLADDEEVEATDHGSSSNWQQYFHLLSFSENPDGIELILVESSQVLSEKDI